ncbi:hypothetical protein [Scytonema sp. UIC 10036]|nr:hypothetical protein [Scytonema sp. UIC 10036]
MLKAAWKVGNILHGRVDIANHIRDLLSNARPTLTICVAIK